MTFRLYVGNYPNAFTNVELLNLFSDFDNLIVERMCLKGNKSFAFVSCIDFDQALSIVKNLNGTDVSGRRLVVRAKDESLQEYVNVLLQEEEDNSPVQHHTKVLHKRKVEEFNKHVFTPIEFKKASVDLKSRDKQLSDSKCNHLKSNQNTPLEQMHRTSISKKSQESYDGRFFNSGSSTSRPVQNISHGQTLVESSNSKVKERKSCEERFSESKYNYCKLNQSIPLKQMHKTSFVREFQEPDKHFSNSNSKPIQNISHKQMSVTSSQNKARKSHEEQFSESKFNSLKANQNSSREPHWISVSNFAIGTSENSIYELFSDYNPTDVKIICNSPRKDKRLTEAYVCFCNEDIAFEVILNFDNTVYMGRTILVNDTADPDLLTELMSITRI